MRVLKRLLSRATFMIVMALVEIVAMFSLFYWFRTRAAWIEAVLRVLSLLIVLAINKNSRHLSSDLMWVFIIILLPVAGTALYLLLGANLVSSRTFRAIFRSTAEAKRYYSQDPGVLSEACEKAPALAGQFRYISESAGFPVYRNTGFDYYGLGEQGYPVMLEALRSAERFIFLEYFIIEEGTMWNGILSILEEKAKAGLDVRVMYDDMGSFGTLPLSYAKKLEEKGIRCVPFNRINPVLGIVMNHRDHRKIMVIDGKTAFSGGVNLADEYINAKQKYGHWKDNMIRVTGEAVWSFTVMFLTHWNALCPEDADFGVFREKALPGEADGYIAAYGETPLDNEITAQNVYVNILNGLLLHHDAVSDHRYGAHQRAHPRCQAGGGRADSHARDPGQKADLAHHALLLPPADRRRCAHLRIYAGLRACQGLRCGRLCRNGGHGKSGLPEPVSPF